MQELISFSISVWNLYWGEGIYQYLLLLAALFLLICRWKNGQVRYAVYFTGCVLFLFFCPFTARLIQKCIGTAVFWRVLWLIPLIPLLALGITTLIQKQKSRLRRNAVLLAALLLIALSGKGMLRAGSYERLANYQKVPNEVALICDLIQEKAEQDGLSQIRVAADDALASYIRVYDASILMPFGRSGQGALTNASEKLYQLINQASPTYKTYRKIARYAKRTGCSFVVLPESGRDPHKVMAKKGYQDIGKVGGYTIYQLIED